MTLFKIKPKSIFYDRTFNLISLLYQGDFVG